MIGSVLDGFSVVKEAPSRTRRVKAAALLHCAVHLVRSNQDRLFDVDRPCGICGERERRGANVIRKIGNRVDIRVAKRKVQVLQFAPDRAEELFHGLPSLGATFGDQSLDTIPGKGYLN